MKMVPWRNKRGNGELAPLAQLRSEMDRLFDSFMRDPFGSLSESFGGAKAWPTIDITENDRDVVVRAEVPGVDPKEFEVTLSGNRLTLSGEKHEKVEKNEGDYYHSESRYGWFSRTIELPSEVDAEHVTAEHRNGVVTIRLKKTKPAEAKRIAINANSN